MSISNLVGWEAGLYSNMIMSFSNLVGWEAALYSIMIMSFSNLVGWEAGLYTHDYVIFKPSRLGGSLVCTFLVEPIQSHFLSNHRAQQTASLPPVHGQLLLSTETPHKILLYIVTSKYSVKLSGSTGFLKQQVGQL